MTLLSISFALLAACGDEDDPAASSNAPTGTGTGSAMLSWGTPHPPQGGCPPSHLPGYRS